MDRFRPRPHRRGGEFPAGDPQARTGPGPSGETQAPHVDISIFARGLLQRLVTRLYFPDEAALNASDPVLSGLGDAALASRLVASREEGNRSLRFDIRLQGEQETVFFAPW